MCPKPESTTDFAEQDEVCGEDVNLSHPTSSTLSQGDATQCSDEGNTGHELAAEHGVHHPPTSHDYHLGYDATCPNAEDWSYIPSQEGLVAPCSDAQTDDIVCRMPGYDKYASESVRNVNAEYVGQQPYLYSAGCPPQVVFRRPDSVPVNSCNSKQDVGESETVPKSLSNSKQNLLAAKAVGPSSSEGPNFRKASPLDTMHHLYTSNFPGQVSKSRSEIPRVNSGTRPVGDTYRHQHCVNFSSFPKQEQSGFQPRHSFDRSRPIGQTVNNNYYSHRIHEASSELVRGPRANRINISSSKSSTGSNSVIRREQFNKSDFQIKYAQAKFFMIKSYSEDDIHKSIKYSVWASTPNGNKKLDAAFIDAEMETKKMGTKCPIFLFFSVNASGQFVGLAEMMGPVDFKKTMDFWQQDKWSGFFPVTWHVIKDIPNRQFQNITLENNDNRAVTFSRDTQEIGLPQGLKMLFIFKGYPSGTSILDDFEFYENRAKSLHLKRSSSSSGSVLQHSRAEFDDEYDSMNQLETSFRKMNVPASYDQKPTLFNHNSSSSLNYQVRENRN